MSSKEILEIHCTVKFLFVQLRKLVAGKENQIINAKL